MVKQLQLALTFSAVFSTLYFLLTLYSLAKDPQAGIGFVLLPIYFSISFIVAYIVLLVMTAIRRKKSK